MMMRGGDGDALGGRLGMAGVIPLQIDRAAAGEMAAISGGTGGGGGQRVKEEKVPQWGQQETRELIAIRADLERDFTLARRNKTLWVAVASRMRERGYRRSPDQCKCKWKNLVNRYKGSETAGNENGRQCPFFEEIHAVFTERAINMQRLMESEAGTPQSKKNPKRIGSDRLSDELSDDEDDDEDSDEEKPSRCKKKKAEGGAAQLLQPPQNRVAVDKLKAANSIHDLLQDFFQKQQQIESHWWEMMDRRAFERQRFEQEWRQSMEKLERERFVLEHTWGQREEQRRMIEECRAEKRDALLSTLLNKLIQDDL